MYDVNWDKVIDDAFFEAIDICFFDEVPEEVYPPDDTEEDFLAHENEQRELHYGGQSEFRDHWTLDE